MVRIGELVIKRVVQISPFHGIAQNHRESAKIIIPAIDGTCPVKTTSKVQNISEIPESP
jgi:hypothetical protein